MIKSCLHISMILLALTLAGNVHAEGTVRLASGEWSPYLSKNLKHGGVVSRIIAEAFALEGIRVEYGYFPWTRSFEYAKTGKWDGSLIWVDTPERRRLFYFSDSVIDLKYVLFHKKKLIFDWEHIEDLKPFRIGATLGYDYGLAFQQAEKKGVIRVVRKPSDTDNFLRLFKDEIHLFPCEIEVGYELILRNFGLGKTELFSYHPRPFRSAPHYLLLSKNNPRNKDFIQRFNAGLQKLKASGKYNQYLEESRRGAYLK